VITCAADSEIRHIDTTDPKKPVIRTFTEHKGMVKKLEIDPNSAHVFLSCSQDGTARFYDLRQKNNSSDSQIIVDLRTGRSRLYHTNHTVDINSISLNMADSNYFTIGGGDSFLRLYDRRTCKCVKRFAPSSMLEEPGEEGHITGVRFNKSGTAVLASYSDDDIYLFPIDFVNQSQISHLVECKYNISYQNWEICGFLASCRGREY
jgi:WD40 repeat protein